MQPTSSTLLCESVRTSTKKGLRLLETYNLCFSLSNGVVCVRSTSPFLGREFLRDLALSRSLRRPLPEWFTMSMWVVCSSTVYVYAAELFPRGMSPSTAHSGAPGPSGSLQAAPPGWTIPGSWRRRRATLLEKRTQNDPSHTQHANVISEKDTIVWWRPSLLGWRPSLLGWRPISRLEAIGPRATCHRLVDMRLGWGGGLRQSFNDPEWVQNAT